MSQRLPNPNAPTSLVVPATRPRASTTPMPTSASSNNPFDVSDSTLSVPTQPLPSASPSPESPPAPAPPSNPFLYDDDAAAYDDSQR